MEPGSGYVNGLMLDKAKRLSFSLRDHVMGSSPILATQKTI
jgi:hypothetical protein